VPRGSKGPHSPLLSAFLALSPKAKHSITDAHSAEPFAHPSPPSTTFRTPINTTGCLQRTRKKQNSENREGEEAL